MFLFNKLDNPCTGIECDRDECKGIIIKNPQNIKGSPFAVCNICNKVFSKEEYEKLVEESKQSKGPPAL